MYKEYGRGVMVNILEYIPPRPLNVSDVTA